MLLRFLKKWCVVLFRVDRVMMPSLYSHLKGKISALQVYAPTTDKDEATIETLYEQIDNVLNLRKRPDINFIMG